MKAITKRAIKAIKFHKHVVQSVEKFIQKVCLALIELTWSNAVELILFSFVCLVQCLPEYKIPGLYVIDSIVKLSQGSNLE